MSQHGQIGAREMEQLGYRRINQYFFRFGAA
jgi:hypothetical protein